MSASEKLKSPDFDHRDDFDVDSWAALVAVVEAAELYREVLDDANLLNITLTALEEALS